LLRKDKRELFGAKIECACNCGIDLSPLKRRFLSSYTRLKGQEIRTKREEARDKRLETGKIKKNQETPSYCPPHFKLTLT
jgi:hypothetical protein